MHTNSTQPVSLPALLVSPDLLPGFANGAFNGRRVAGNQLLRLWGSMAGEEEVALVGASPSDLPAYAKQLEKGGHSGAACALPLTDPLPVSSYGAFFTPDPALGLWSRWRWGIGADAFSIIGQTHTLCSNGALPHLDALGTDPLHSWDALICSSTAGQAVAQQLLEARIEQLSIRFGVDSSVALAQSPQLPVIPLPVDVESIQTQLPDQASARLALDLPPDAHVLIWLGRLSLLTKFDPWPQYRMLERLAAKLEGQLVLIQVGPDDTAQQAEHFRKLLEFCPTLRVVRLGGAQPVSEEEKLQALAAADLAISLVDNLQETFGLAIAEAMAAGLPVVASNWDGYRDSLRDGLDGFLVPTAWASTAKYVSHSLGWQHHLGVLPYTQFSGSLAQLISVDMEAAESSIRLLLQDKGMRKRMGDQAAARALDRFALCRIASQYKELFEQLHHERMRFKGSFQLRSEDQPMPWRQIDPVQLFAGFASHSAWMQSDDCEPVPSLVSDARSGLWTCLSDAIDKKHRQQLKRDLHGKHT